MRTTLAKYRRSLAAVGAGAAIVVGAVVGTSSCAQTPPNIPVRSFDRAQKMDVVCLHVERVDTANGFITNVYPTPLPQTQCSPTPINVDGNTLENHLFALVTQSTRGEVAVVDLNAGGVVDIDNSTPGINFLPVGKNPTDIAAAPDGAMTYVASAEVGKPAIYALDSRVILGNSRAPAFDRSTTPPGAPTALQVPTLTTWPSCSLPQTPGAMSIVPAGAPADADAGTADAGDDAGESDAGTTAPSPFSAYTIAVVLPGDEVDSAKVVTLDPAQFTDGTIAPGSLTPCRILSAVALSGNSAATWSPGPAWDDGIPFDGGSLTTSDLQVPNDPNNPDAGTHTERQDNAPSAGRGLPPVAASCPNVDGGLDDAGVNALPTLPPAAPSGGFIARNGTTLYIADLALPLIHVVDVSNPAAPKELDPLLATSQLDTSRRVLVGQMAISPPTRDYKTYLYALDQKEGSIIVFDISDPVASPHVPMTRPHAELNPFLAPDRISFSSPIASVAFASHDFSPLNSTAIPRGLLCNPNLNAGLSLPPLDPGAYYRANVDPSNLEGDIGLGPNRLRGIFAFATLTNGAIVLIDVDDWDSPCRRPDPMQSDTSKLVSGITPFEPFADDDQDLNPYHAPTTSSNKFTYVSGYTTATSEEPFFPVSAPNRVRSVYLLRKDPVTGAHAPNLVSPPTLFSQLTSPVSLTDATPLMMPTYSDLADSSYFSDPDNADPSARQPTLPAGVDPSKGANDPKLSNPLAVKQSGIRIAWEDPTVHYNQDWTVTYEGVLPDYNSTPGQNGVSGTLTTTDKYQTLVLSAPNPLFCRHGIEDAQVGGERATTFDAALAPYGITPPVRLDHRVGDYLQLSEDLLASNDPYWSEDDSSDPNGTCWDFDAPKVHSDPADRYNTCQSIYGNASDQKISRDFPIWQAFDDHLVVTRYGYTDSTLDPTTREIVGPDPSNVALLKAMRCCFHRQVQFHVRSGGAWLAVGSVSGLLNHITKGDAGACVQSCEPREQLLNGRSIGIPRVGLTNDTTPPDRNSVLAMRNPMFAYLIWDGVDGTGKVDLLSARDMQWKFSMSGQFSPQLINYAGSSSAAVSPQSMRFLDSFRRIAIVDGSAQGLVLIDLDNVAVNGGPYY